MPKKIQMISGTVDITMPEVPKSIEPPPIADAPQSESLSDDAIEEVFQRAAEIDELTLQYLSDLIGIDGEIADSIAEGIDAETLAAIEDEFESILANYGVIIFRPTIVEGEDGKEKIVSSIYDAYE